MKKYENLPSLLAELHENERKKFEYILNFYTEEHVFYNFNQLREELSNYNVVSCRDFKRPLEPKLKELVDNISLSTMIRNFQTIKTMVFETESKSVSDFLLYLTDYTDEPDSKKIATIKKLRKYDALINEGYINPEEVLESIRKTFFSEIEKTENIDLQDLEKKLELSLREKIYWNTEFAKNLGNDEPYEEMMVSPDVARRIRKVDKENAFKKQNGVITGDVTILLLKSIAGDDFEHLTHAEIERVKAVLKTFNYKDLKEDDIGLIEDNFELIYKEGLSIEELYYVKNIVRDDSALRAYERLPEELREEVLKLNIVSTTKEITQVMEALTFCKTTQLEQEREPLKYTKYHFSELPPEKRAQMVELVQDEELLKEYKKDLGLRFNPSFGFELEVNGISENVVKNLVVQRQLAHSLYSMQNAGSGINLNWTIDYDGTVPKGVEVISPVLRNNEKSWNELKEVCQTLTSLGAEIDQNCGGHIHIGADILGTNGKAWENFFKIWSAAESIIYKVSNKSEEDIRISAIREAAPSKPLIDKILERGSIELNDSRDVKKLADEYTRLYLDGKTYSGRGKGLNLCPIAEGKQNTIEFRIPNGSIDYVEIQRTANFYARIMEAARIIAEEPEYRKDSFDGVLNGKTEEERMVKLLDLLFDKTTDKAVFYERFFSKPKELYLSAQKYDDIIKAEVKRNDNERYEWRGHR